MVLLRRTGQGVANQSQIPVAQGREGRERLGRRNAGVARGPLVLVEGLDGWPILGESLAQPECEDNLAVGEVANDFCRAPFAGLGRQVEAVWADRVETLGDDTADEARIVSTGRPSRKLSYGLSWLIAQSS